MESECALRWSARDVDKHPEKSSAINAAQTQPANGNPCSHVLETVELVEHILMYQQSVPLYGLQRVCRLWQRVISTSPRIQETLFLRPPESAPLKWFARVSSADRKTATLIPESENLDRDVAVSLFRLNAMLIGVRPGHPIIARGPRGDRNPATGTIGRFTTHLPVRLNGLWRHVYLTDPPCTTFRLWRSQYAPTEDDYAEDGNMLGRWFTKAGGVRVGGVLEVLDTEIPAWRSDDMRVGIGAMSPLIDLAGSVQGGYDPSARWAVLESGARLDGMCNLLRDCRDR